MYSKHVHVGNKTQTCVPSLPLTVFLLLLCLILGWKLNPVVSAVYSPEFYAGTRTCPSPSVTIFSALIFHLLILPVSPSPQRIYSVLLLVFLLTAVTSVNLLSNMQSCKAWELCCNAANIMSSLLQNNTRYQVSAALGPPPIRKPLRPAPPVINHSH